MCVCVCVCVCVCMRNSVQPSSVEPASSNEFTAQRMKADQAWQYEAFRWDDYCSSNEEFRGYLRGVMVNVLDCEIIVKKFELQSRYYVHFLDKYAKKKYEPLILPAIC